MNSSHRCNNTCKLWCCLQDSKKVGWILEEIMCPWNLSLFTWINSAIYNFAPECSLSLGVLNVTSSCSASKAIIPQSIWCVCIVPKSRCVPPLHFDWTNKNTKNINRSSNDHNPISTTMSYSCNAGRDKKKVCHVIHPSQARGAASENICLRK